MKSEKRLRTKLTESERKEAHLSTEPGHEDDGYCKAEKAGFEVCP